MSMFNQKVGNDPINGVIGGVIFRGRKPDGPKCPQCKSQDTIPIARDMVWDETTYRCNKCDRQFIK